MELLGGDSGKIRQIEQDIAAEMGFTRVVPVSGQTYSRKMDYMVVSTLSGIAQTASKFSYDMRLLQNFKEMEEPFEASQDVYKRQLYARRSKETGYAFSHDNPWQREFEDLFPYELTEDQQKSVAQIEADMESPRNMDRLLCGDVGYGCLLYTSMAR